MFDYIGSIVGAVVANVVAGLLITIITERTHGPKRMRAAKQRYIILIILTILISSTSAIGIVHWIETPPEARPVFSDFSGCTPVNNYGIHWGIFNDNPYNGNSYVAIKTKAHSANADRCFALITFHLGPESSIKPYCGVFSGFSPKVGASRDVSRFSGIRLNVWNDGSLPDGVRVFLQLSPAQMVNWYDGFFEYDLTENVKKSQPSPETIVPFEMFRPSQPLLKIGFKGGFGKSYQSQLYQVSVVIQGEKGISSQGNVAFDNFTFY